MQQYCCIIVIIRGVVQTTTTIKFNQSHRQQRWHPPFCSTRGDLVATLWLIIDFTLSFPLLLPSLVADASYAYCYIFTAGILLFFCHCATSCLLLFCCQLLVACMLPVDCYFFVTSWLLPFFVFHCCQFTVSQHFLLSCSCICCHLALTMHSHWRFMRHQFFDAFCHQLIVTFCYQLIVAEPVNFSPIPCWPNSPSPLDLGPRLCEDTVWGLNSHNRLQSVKVSLTR